jgi:membrane protease YdiL (CAAX protease family)
MRRNGKSFKDIGFNKPTLKVIAYVLSGFAMYFFVLLIVQAIITKLIPAYNIDEAQSTGYENVEGVWQIIMAFVGLVIIPPLVEEFIFRGFLYQSLKSKWPKHWAAIITSGLFALAHGQWNVAVDTFILSMVLIYLLEKTNNIWASVGLHALKNCIAFVFLLHTAGVF